MEIYISDIYNSTPKVIGDGKYTIAFPSWSYDGRYIVYSKLIDENKHQLCIYDMLTDTENVIYERPDIIFYPKFSPDGQYIAFASPACEFTENYYDSVIWLMTKDGKHIWIITDYPYPDNDTYEYSSNISWSPDGKWIVYDVSKIITIVIANSGRCVYLSRSILSS